MSGSSTERRSEVYKVCFDVLLESGGQISSSDLIAKIEERISPSDHERETFESNGTARWITNLRFDSIRAVKAGWIRKKKRIWNLTDEGRVAAELPQEDLWRESVKAWNKWKAENRKDDNAETQFNDSIDDSSETSFEQASELAQSSIRNHIFEMDGYEFQDLVAALLRGMGYHTPFVAPPGKDGGVDILAYRDPFGTIEPRIKVQVKHRNANKVSSREIRELISSLKKQGDTGLVVSSGGFTADALIEVRHSQVHLETLDLDQFIDHWENYYDKMPEEDRALCPLRRLAFLAPESD